MGTGGGMQRWKSAEGAAEDVAEKDKLPFKNYAHCDSFDTVTFNYTSREGRLWRPPLLRRSTQVLPMPVLLMQSTSKPCY